MDRFSASALTHLLVVADTHVSREWYVEVAARHARVALEGDGNPVVVWREEQGSTQPPASIHVKAWDGASWQALGGALNDDPDRAGPMNGMPDVQVGGAGDPIG